MQEIRCRRDLDLLMMRQFSKLNCYDNLVIIKRLSH